MQHIEGRFKGYGGLDLYDQAWLPDEDWKAIIVVVHGLAEHSGRYMNLVNYFVPKGYAICSFDQRGHGKSKGRRGYVERFSHYLDDLDTFLEMIHKDHGTSQIFLFGHSMGGTIATAYAVEHRHELAGLMLSAPTVRAGSSVSKMDVIMARVLSVLLPKAGVAVIDATAVSRDKAVVDAYINDPLVYRGKINARLGAELINVIEKKLPSQMARISLPILILHATADRLSNPQGSDLLYKQVSSKDKTLKYYEGLYHEIFNEPERGEVLADMEAWLSNHIK